MGLLIWPEILAALALVAIMARVRTSPRMCVSEESAHAEALERKRSGESRRNTRESILILGGGQEQDHGAPCRILSISPRTIRIHSPRLIRPDAQLQVESGGDCFVCAVRSVAGRDRAYVLDLKVLASNSRPSAWETAWDAFIRLLRQLAVKLLRAELRVRK